MKLFLFLLVAASYSISAKAQQEESFKNKLLDQYRKNKSIEDAFKRFNAPTVKKYHYLVPKTQPLPRNENKMMVLKVPLNGFYDGTNGTGGDIYSMQPDNMPCLVPGKSFKSNMPVVKSENADFKLQLDRSPTKPQEKK